MYKVFFNDSTISIGIETKKSLKNNIVQLEKIDSYDIVNQIVSHIESGGKLTDALIVNHDVKLLWDYFRRCFIEIPAAGGFVRNSEGLFLFIKRLGLWDLPKGKIEKNESWELAAMREVEEECGISGLNIVRQLDPTFHIYRSPFIPAPKNFVLKETKWFLMTYSGNETLVPQVDEDIEDVQWITKSEFSKVLDNTYESLRDFIQKTIPLI